MDVKSVTLAISVFVMSSGSHVGAALAQDEDARFVSMVQLLASPERFENRRVLVIGVLRTRAEEFALYLSQQDDQVFNSASAVWLDIPKLLESTKRLDGSVVVIEGTFTATQNGHMGVYPGSLVGISRIDRIRTRSERSAKARVPTRKR